MPIAVLVLALVAYGYAMLSYPEFRRPGLIGGVLVAAALAAYFMLQAPNPIGPPSASSRTRSCSATSRCRTTSAARP